MRAFKQIKQASRGPSTTPGPPHRTAQHPPPGAATSADPANVAAMDIAATDAAPRPGRDRAGPKRGFGQKSGRLGLHSEWAALPSCDTYFIPKTSS